LEKLAKITDTTAAQEYVNNLYLCLWCVKHL